VKILFVRENILYYACNEKLKDTKAVIRSVIRRTENIMAKRKRAKRQTTIYKTLQRKLMIEQHEPH
jgi:hypothetical protein